MARNPHDTIRAMDWSDSGLRLLDQRVLPERQEYLTLHNVEGVTQAIRDMVVRGAPAIGITAAFGVVLAARARYSIAPVTWKQDIEADFNALAAARPTAVNLAWALARMRRLITQVEGDPSEVLLAEARRIHHEDVTANHRMGELGASLIEAGSGVLTHCNTGSLATGGYGTALGVIRSAFANGKVSQVYADETRPWLQGARLTAWELVQDGIPVTLIAEGAAAALMRTERVQWVIVGADRVAANGDVANKIGTYGLAVLARQHGVRFMVVAPSSTVDMETINGNEIPIETRSPSEVLSVNGRPVAAAGAQAWNPVFDVTPAALVDVIVTEKGLVERPSTACIADLMRG